MFVFFLIAVLAVFLILTIVNVFSVKDLGRQRTGQYSEVISVLIPARNEASNVEKAIRSLVPNLQESDEVLVVDDNSEDETWELLGRLEQEIPQLSCFQGSPLPEGALGKPHACQQLSERAKGDLLLFMDADIEVLPQALSKSVNYLRDGGLAFFSAFPEQITLTWTEKLVVPLMEFFLYVFLPFPFVRLSKLPRFSAANGQWMLFTREAYQEIGGHRAVINQVLEDVCLARKIKEHGLPMEVLSGLGAVRCRMYHGAAEVWQGFSKNVFAASSYNAKSFSAFLAFMLVIFLLPFFLVCYPFYWIPVSMILAIKALLAFRFGGSLIDVVILHPLSMVLGFLICINSMRVHFLGKTEWKGRIV